MNGPPVLGPIVGDSPAIRRARELIERYAPTALPILLVGATGTGKDLVAQHIHHQSGRRRGLVSLNCAALPRETAESLLFGHRKGAFTGAIESRPGYFRLADRRTLFLDELLSLPLECQAKLLRAVDTGEVWPLGENEPVHVDVRIVAAVQQDVLEHIDHGSLRRDLLSRLAGIVVQLPPLVERLEDVSPLARYLASVLAAPLEPGAESALLTHAWPQNVRELRQVIARAAMLQPGRPLSATVLGEAIALGSVESNLSPTAEHNGHAKEQDRARVLAACQACGWRSRPTAAALGIDRATLFRRLRTFGWSLRSLRKSQSRMESRD